MRKLVIVSVLIASGAALAACGTTGGDRALTGAAIGAAAGQAIGHDTKSTVTGAAIGGVAGAVTR